MLSALSLQQQPHSGHTSNTGFLQRDSGRRKGNKTKLWPKGCIEITVGKLKNFTPLEKDREVIQCVNLAGIGAVANLCLGLLSQEM